MNVNEIFYLMIPSRWQNVNLVRIYYKKRQISIFLKNVNNSKNNQHF